MKIIKLTEKIKTFGMFELIALFFVMLGWLGVILALVGFFYYQFIVVYILIYALLVVYIFSEKHERIRIRFDLALVLIISILAISVFIFFSSPTVFSGRDQGTFSEAAIRLAENHRLDFSSEISQEVFNIYGPGEALNFPGFSYQKDGQLTISFLIGYSAWLAVFYSFFGLFGLIMANAISLLIFVVSLYSIARYFMKIWPAFFIVLLVLSNFVFAWFFKFTLSENLTWMLVWFGIYESLAFLKSGNRLKFSAVLLSFGLLAFTRLETLIFLAIIFVLVYYRFRKKTIKAVGLVNLAIILMGMVIYIFSIFVNKSFYILFGKNLIRTITGFGISSAEGLPGGEFWHVVKILHTYSLLSLIILGIMGILFTYRAKIKNLPVPFIILSPAFIYLIDPNISDDHPWMLRRFAFAVLPASIFYAVWFLDYFFLKKFYFYLMAIIILGANLMITFQYLNFVPHENLLAQTDKLSWNFGENDLVLIDRLATGDGWSMIGGPLNFLYDKQALYFFNPADLDKIDLKKFDSVYFIIPDQNIDFYQKSGILDRIRPFKDYRLDNQFLEGKDSSQLPVKQKINVYGKIYILEK